MHARMHTILKRSYVRGAHPPDGMSPFLQAAVMAASFGAQSHHTLPRKTCARAQARAHHALTGVHNALSREHRAVRAVQRTMLLQQQTDGGGGANGKHISTLTVPPPTYRNTYIHAYMPTCLHAYMPGQLYAYTYLLVFQTLKVGCAPPSANMMCTRAYVYMQQHNNSKYYITLKALHNTIKHNVTFHNSA